MRIYILVHRVRVEEPADGNVIGKIEIGNSEDGQEIGDNTDIRSEIALGLHLLIELAKVIDIGIVDALPFIGR